MSIKEYTAKKTIGKKITIKTREGGYDSNESSAEVTATFSGDVDTKKANAFVKQKALDLLNDEPEDDDPDWIKDKSYGRPSSQNTSDKKK